MKKYIIITAMFVFGFSGVCLAAGNDTTTINYSVAAINELNMRDIAFTLSIEEATAGQELTPMHVEGLYDLTTNCALDSKKMTAQINTNMPSGVVLALGIEAATGALSSSIASLTSTPQNCMTGIDATAQSDLRLNLDLQATVSAGVVPSASKTLTVTLTDS